MYFVHKITARNNICVSDNTHVTLNINDFYEQWELKLVNFVNVLNSW